MDFFETPEEIARQLEFARARLKEFEERIDTSALLERLRSAHPFHPALLARKLFLLMVVLGFAAGIGVGVLPFTVDELPPWHVALERSGVPAPVVFGAFALFMALARFMATQAAIAVARDCPMNPSEQREHERLVNEMKRLASQKQLLDRSRAGTPMGARPRGSTPAPLTARYASPVGAPMRPYSSFTGSPSPARATPAAPPAERTYTPPMAAADEHPTPRPVMRSATPLGAPPRHGPPVGKLGRKAVSASAITQSDDPLDDVDDLDSDPTPQAVPVLKPVPSAHQSRAESNPTGGYEQRFSSDFPKWGAVDEPWLEEAIQKSELLASGFPVQAHLHFSAERDLPFTLVLERATPAMAVRAMVSFVEFLASISTPKRARIVLRSVPHLDRSFHRNVEAALEPYFGDNVSVSREGDQIDVEFTEPDPGWDAYELLPTE